MAFEGRRAGVIGRTPAQLIALGNTILASLDGAADIDVLSAELSRATTRETKQLLFDPNEALTLPRRDVEAEGKLRTNIWTRIHAQIAEAHLFATPSEKERRLTQRFAEVVEKLSLNPEDLLDDFRSAVDATDAESEMASLWKLLASVVPEHERTRPVMDPIQGAKRFFEERYLDHVHRVARECGMPTGRTQDAIRMYVHKKLNPHDSSYPAWTLVYVAIRCGDYTAATEFAGKATFPGGCRCETPEYYLRTLMQRPSYVACRRFPELEQACVQFMHTGARRKLSSAYRYMLMSVAFLCGQIHVADTLISESAQSWDSLDEFLWFALGCVRSGSGPAVPFDYKRLRSRLSSYQEMYYTENGQHPMRYALVLFSGLQFGSALYYLMTQNVAVYPYVMHVVHMAIALHHHGLLALPEAADPKQLKPEDVADLVLHYGHSLAASKNPMAWHYYILAQSIRRNGAQLSNDDKARALVDLLTRSCDVSVLESGNVLEHSIQTTDERRTIFELAAAQCIELKAFEVAAILYNMIDSVADAVAACHQMTVHLLIQCARLSGTAQKEQRMALLRDVHRTLEYIQETLGNPTEETRALGRIAEVFHAHSMGDDHILELIRGLDFIPAEKDEILEAVEKLQNSYPCVIPLLSSLMHIACEACQNLDRQKMSHIDRNTCLELLSVFQEFVHSIPPPFTDNQSTWKELEETADLLKNVS